MQNMFNTSLLSSADENKVDYRQHKYSNSFLRVGTILKHFPKDHEQNNSKQFDEYEVSCTEQFENKGITRRTYVGCVSAVSFGSASDFCYFKYQETKDKQDILTGKGSKTPEGARVLLLMIDGFSESPIIIGALPHPDSPAPLEGKSLVFKYNDLKASIADNGDFSLEFLKSKSRFTVNSKGDVSIFIKDGFQLDLVEKDGSFALIVPELIDIKTKKINVNASDSVNVAIGKLLITGKESALKIDQVSIEGSKLEVKSKQIKFEGSQFIVKGSLIKIEGKTVTISGSKISLGKGGSAALNALTKMQGLGNLGAPVISSVMSGASTTVTIK